MRWISIGCLTLAVFAGTACATAPENRITGHRIVHLEEIDVGTAGQETESDGEQTGNEPKKREPFLYISFTNVSSDDIRVSEVTIVGVDGVNFSKLEGSVWPPGRVWLFRIAGAFLCQIPVLASVVYEYQYEDEWHARESPELVELSGRPTALPFDSLERCTKENPGLEYE